MHNRLACFLFLMFCNSTQAQQVDIYSYYIPGLIDSTENGVLVEMLNKIKKSTKIDFKLKLLPTKRVQASFINNKIAGYFPELEENRPKASCRTISFKKKEIIAITRKGEPKVTSIEDLFGKRVGGVKGFSYGHLITQNPDISLSFVDNDKKNIKKLLSNRIDVIIGDTDSTVNAINDTASNVFIYYDLANPINVIDAFFVFQDTDEGNVFCKKVSSAIEELRKTGDLLHWFGYQ